MYVKQWHLNTACQKCKLNKPLACVLIQCPYHYWIWWKKLIHEKTQVIKRKILDTGKSWTAIIKTRGIHPLSYNNPSTAESDLLCFLIATPLAAAAGRLVANRCCLLCLLTALLKVIIIKLTKAVKFLANNQFTTASSMAIVYVYIYHSYRAVSAISIGVACCIWSAG